MAKLTSKQAHEKHKGCFNKLVPLHEAMALLNEIEQASICVCLAGNMLHIDIDGECNNGASISIMISGDNSATLNYCK